MKAYQRSYRCGNSSDEATCHRVIYIESTNCTGAYQVENYTKWSCEK